MAQSPAPHRLRQARAAMCVVVVSFVVTLGLAMRRVPTNVVPPAASMLATGINPNTAPWYELAQLPGIGESVGRRMVAYRVLRQDRRIVAASAVPISAESRVFRRPGDLAQVSGIGIRTVRRIAPFLRFEQASVED